MTTYQVLTLMLLFGGFLLTLLGYIDKKNRVEK